jgi:ligand-binding sensor domain-containing protein/signal transduction histidine kinase
MDKQRTPMFTHGTLGWKVRRLMLMLAALLALQLPCRAGELLTDYTRHVWHVQDGLVDQVVQALAQTPDRYLWIGTTKGLIRFDGRNFVPYTGAGAGALSHGVTALVVARDGTLYIGTEGGGLLHLHNGAMDEFGQEHGLTNSIVRSLLEDRTGRLWVGTDRGCFRGTAQGFERVLPEAAYPNLGVASIIEDRNGAVWIGGSKLLRLANGRMDNFVLPAQNGSMRIKALTEDEHGVVWVGTVSGLFRQTAKGSFEKVEGIKGTVRTFGHLPSGALWAGTVGEGVFVRSGAGFTQFKAPDVLPSNTVLSQTTDVEGNLWIGTQAGLLRSSRTGIHWAQLPQALDSDSGTLMRDTDGTLWVCSSHLFRMIHQQLVPYRFPALPEIGIRTLFRDRGGALWIGTAGRGAYRMAADGRVQHYTSEIGTNYIRGFLQARDGSVWIATDGGIGHYRNGHVDNYHELPAAPHGLVLSIAEGDEEQLWVGTLRGLMSFRHGDYEDAGLGDALRDEAIWSLHMDEDGALWIGTGSGLYRLKDHRLFHFQDVLGGPSRAVFQIMGRGDLLWVSGPTRAARYSRAALHALADRGGSEIPPHLLFPVSGEVSAAELYGGMQPAGLLDADGSAWYPSSVGPVHLVTTDKPLHTQIPLVIEQALVDGRSSDGAHTLTLQPGTRTLEIDYAPILLGSQMGIVFRQRLEGFEGWSTPTLAHAAVYTNLPAGRYIFHVQALSPDAAGPIAEATIEVVQLASFYQRPWFWVLCLTAALAAAFGMMRLRVHQIRMRLRAIASERNRMAREMHDTLLQGSIGISTLLEAVASPGTTETSRGQLMDCARQQIAELIGQTRDAMWNLRGHEYEQCDFGLCAETMLDQHVKPAGIEARYSYQGAPLSVDYRIAYELLMSIREALLNAVAHGKGTVVELNIRCEDADLAVEVNDNGIGFNPQRDNAQPSGHYGLQGMRERIHNIGGRMKLESAPGQGTQLRIVVPRATLEHRPNHDLEL